MNSSELLKEPIAAAIFAAAVVGGYIMCKAKLNNKKAPSNSEIIKPGVLIGLLVYFIVSQGNAAKEIISTEPFA